MATKEPHRSRGTYILNKYPHAKRLLGPNRWSILLISLIVAVQTTLAVEMGPRAFWLIIVVAWFFGAILNHALFVLIHESTHNLIFKRTWCNRLAAIVANFPIGMPMAMAFRRFHLLHHTHQGDPEWDADLPTPQEAKLVGNSSFRKALWLVTFLFNESFYRPRFIRHGQTPWRWIILNYSLEIIYCAGLIYFFGVKTYSYLLISTFFSVGLHPLGARWIQEHFVVKEGQETYSYYGPFNYVAFFVGYHCEHHDLPYVAWNRLPAVRRLAPEIYENLYSHSSYWSLLGRFIFDPNVGMFSRIVRRL